MSIIPVFVPETSAKPEPRKRCCAKCKTPFNCGNGACKCHEKRDRQMNPDCKYGKHDACNGDGWDMDADMPMACPCECHEGETK